MRVISFLKRHSYLCANCFLYCSQIRIFLGLCKFIEYDRSVVIPLELFCCKKRKKKSQARNWFGEKETLEGSE